MASLELQNLSKVFERKGETICAVDDLSFCVADGEFVTIIGPSGCGKTTTLRMIAGLEPPSAGKVLIGGSEAARMKPHERDVAMVFQRDALLPHLTALENISLGLKLRGVATRESERRINEAADLLGLRRLLHRLPRELSGGERQRAALARAIVRQPKAFLFDEPLASVDGPMRAQLRLEIARLQRTLGATMLYVTHDQAEAVALGHRVAVMRNGALQQIGQPMTLHESPANAFVAGFIGSPPRNLLRGQAIRRGEGFWFVEHNGGGAAREARIELPLDAQRGARLAGCADGNIIVAVPVDDIVLCPQSPGAVQLEVELVEPMGSITRVHVTSGAHRFIAKAIGNPAVRPGEPTFASFNLARALFFNPASEKPIVL